MMIPWGEVAASRPVWALAAAHAASNFFLYFALAWLPTYFNCVFGDATAAPSSASLKPFIGAALASTPAGLGADSFIANGLAPTAARKRFQSVALVGPGPAIVLAALALAGEVGSLTEEVAEILLVAALSLNASVAAVASGAVGQVLTGAVLEYTDRDFTPMFFLIVLIQLAGAVAFQAWWSSDRVFD